MIHIVFDTESAEALKKSFELDKSLQGEIIIVYDDWSVGPLIGSVNNEGGVSTREDWLKQTLGKGRPEEESPNPSNLIKKALNSNEEEVVWMWIAPNAKDISGYYQLIGTLANFQGRVYVLWLNNLPFINEKYEVFYPRTLNEIPAKEFLKAKMLVQPVSGATFETDPDDWKKLQHENKKLRITEGGRKVTGKDISYFDKSLLNAASAGWQKNKTILRAVSTQTGEIINNDFLLWRIHVLTEQGKLEVKGEGSTSGNFEIRLKLEEKSSAGHE